MADFSRESIISVLLFSGNRVYPSNVVPPLSGYPGYSPLNSPYLSTSSTSQSSLEGLYTWTFPKVKITSYVQTITASTGYNRTREIARVSLYIYMYRKNTLKYYGSIFKFYGRLRLICSVLRASKFAVLKLIEIVILWVYYTIPFGFSFFRHFWGIIKVCRLRRKTFLFLFCFLLRLVF